MGQRGLLEAKKRDGGMGASGGSDGGRQRQRALWRRVVTTAMHLWPRDDGGGPSLHRPSSSVICIVAALCMLAQLAIRVQAQMHCTHM